MEGNAGPAWSFENLTPFSSLGVPRERSLPRPSHDASRRGSSSHRSFHASAAHRARTPDDAAMRERYSASREPTVQANDRPTSAGPAHPSVGRTSSIQEHPAQAMEYGQVPRFEGDGFDMRRPVGWQSRAEGESRARRDQHPVEISDGEDDGHIFVDVRISTGHDNGRRTNVDIRVTPSHNNAVQADRHGSEDVVDLTEEDDAPVHHRLPSHRQPMHDDERPRSQPARAERTPADTARLPRGMAGIINLDNGEEDWTVDDDPIVVAPSSPEIEFVSSRRLDPRNRPAPRPQRSDSDGDDVQFVQERPLTEAERRTRQRDAQTAELDRVIAVLGEHRAHRHTFAHLRGQIDRANAHIQLLADNMRQGGPQPPPRARRADHIHLGVARHVFVRPNLNFGMVGFDLGFERNEPEPPPPTYDAPPPAPEGFTRSPEENDVLVCPNCDSELCKGDNDIKKQVWIAKRCGHVSSRNQDACIARGMS